MNEIIRSYDLSGLEEWRNYLYPNGDPVQIKGPRKIVVTNKGHIVEDCKGVKHFAARGWNHIYWKDKEGSDICNEGDLRILDM